MRADDDDSTLPDGFSYMDPPPGWPPPRSAQDLKLMAQRLQQQLLDHAPPSSRSDAKPPRTMTSQLEADILLESYQARRRKWLAALNDREAVKEAIIRELHDIAADLKG
jgi:hypothetical protein